MAKEYNFLQITTGMRANSLMDINRDMENFTGMMARSIKVSSYKGRHTEKAP